MSKLRVGVLFGGRSGEHEVSLRSARAVAAAMDPERYETVLLAIDKQGRWLLGPNAAALLADASQPQPATDSAPSPGASQPQPAPDSAPSPGASQPQPTTNSAPSPGASQPQSATNSAPSPGASQPQPAPDSALSPGASQPQPPGSLIPQGEALRRLDVIFPVLHGPLGEDGTVQGLLELADIAYVGCGVAASAVGMDKATSKALFAAHGLPQAPYLTLKRQRWQETPDATLEAIEAQLPYPLFVKPANLGSSVGISKAADQASLRQALDEASRYDRKLIVEQGIDAREIEVSVLGNDAPAASLPGEVVPSREFYDYAAKYITDDSTLLIPAPLTPGQTAEVQRLAVAAFLALDGAGMARVDFLLDRQSGQLYLNEVNTIPGFTSISMYPKLWAASGLPFEQLVDRLIELALERHQDKSRNETSFSPRQDG